MIVSTMINMFVGKKGKAIGPLEVMGYDKDGERATGDPSERQQSPNELALRMRLLNAAQKRVGVK